MGQSSRPTLTIDQAFEAMRFFVQAFWEEGLRENDELGMLLGATDRAPDGLPIDSAMWDDWLKAVRKALA